MSLSERWRRTRYRLYAPFYDLVARPLERGRARLLERLAPEPGERILIPGCGTGSDLRHLPPGTRVTAIDAAPEMVRRTADRADELGLDVEARVGDVRDLDFADGSFDAVLLHLVLSVVEDPDALAAETARVLAPGGRVSILDKFVADGEEPSLLRRALNPVARWLFSDITRRLGPILAGTGLETGAREPVLGGLYTATVARRTGEDAGA